MKGQKNTNAMEHDEELSDKRDISGSENIKNGVKNSASSVLSDAKESAEIGGKQIRIYLVRHYPYKNESTKESYRHIEEIPLNERMKLQAGYDGIFTTPNRVLFLYDNSRGLPRVISTAEDLLKNYPIPVENIDRAIKLPGTFDCTKEENKEEKLERKIRTLEEVRVLAHEKLKEKSLQDIDTIVIVTNRTYSEPFDLFAGGEKDLTQNKLESSGYLYRDFTAELHPILPKRTSLRISPENYKSIQSLFPEIQSSSCQELQRRIEQYFERNKNLYTSYLDNPLLGTFCLANLLLSPTPENIQSVKQYLHGFRANRKPLPLDMLQVFLEVGGDTPLAREALLISILATKSKQNWGTDTQREAHLLAVVNLCDTTKIRSMYDELSLLAKILGSSDATADDIFGKSLDALVQNKQLLSRTLSIYRRKSEEELKKLREEKQGTLSREDEYTKVPMSLESLIMSQSPLPHILIGHVGEGKSTELARMKEEIDTNPAYINYIALFYSAKAHNRRSIIEEIRNNIDSLQKHFPEKKIVVFFDGIDELGGEIREGILTGLKEIHSTEVNVILGSRPLGFDKYENVDIQTIYFGKIGASEREQFLRSRLENLGVRAEMIEKKLQEIENFLEKPTLSEELKETPLILYFLTELCVSGELGTIQNRADLYERMIEKILTKHQGKKVSGDEENNPTLGKAYLKSLKQTLSFCAYLMHKSRGKKGGDEKVLKREDVKVYLKKFIVENMETEPSEEELEKLVDKIFLLYQLEGGEYQFILKSFEEYFLARYIWTQREVSKDGATEGEAIIYRMRDDHFESWNEWRNFRPVVLFYGEMLANNGDVNGLERFLGEEGLLRNDDMFGEGFFMGLEILYKLPEELRENMRVEKIGGKYEENMGKWDLYEIIKKFTLIKRLTKALGNINQDGLQPITLKLEAPISQLAVSYRKNSSYNVLNLISSLLIFMAEVGTPEGTKRSGEHCKAILNNTLAWVHAPNETLMFANTYKKIAGIGTSWAIEYALNGVEYLIKIGQYLPILEIYKTLMKTNDQTIKLVLNQVNKYNLNLMQVYEVMAEIGTPATIKEMVKGSDSILEALIEYIQTGDHTIKTESDMFLKIYRISSKSEVGKELCKKMSDTIKNAEQSTPYVVPYALKNGFDSQENEQFITSFLQEATISIENGLYFKAWRCYDAIIDHRGNENVIQEVVKGLKMIAYEGGKPLINEISTTLHVIEDELGDIQYKEVVKNILMEFILDVKTDSMTPKKKRKLVRRARELLRIGKYIPSLYEYLLLLKINEPEATLSVIAGIKEFINRNRYQEGSILFNEILRTKTEKEALDTVVTIVSLGAEGIIDIQAIGRLDSKHVGLLQQELLRLVHDFLSNKEILRAQRIYAFLHQFNKFVNTSIQ